MKSFSRSGAFVALAALTVCFGTWSARSEAEIIIYPPVDNDTGVTPPDPEIDPATGSSALSLVAGVLAMVEQRRRGLKAVLAG